MPHGILDSLMYDQRYWRGQVCRYKVLCNVVDGDDGFMVNGRFLDFFRENEVSVFAQIRNEAVVLEEKAALQSLQRHNYVDAFIRSISCQFICKVVFLRLDKIPNECQCRDIMLMRDRNKLVM